MTSEIRDAFSFGGGGQSTALALLAINRDPRLMNVTGNCVPDLYIFADTGDEPAEVMENVAHMSQLIEKSGADFITVKHREAPLSSHLLDRARSGNTSISLPPLYVATKTGESGPIRRSCTVDFKVVILHRGIKKHFNINARKKVLPIRIRQWMGISHDELQRMNISQHRWFDLFYPLVEMGWRRGDCLKLIESHGMNPVRSACRYCPFHTQREWKRLKSQPDEWEQIVSFERELHEIYDTVGMNLKSKPYLHKSRVAIDEVDFDSDQADMWDMMSECAGVCGV